MCGTGIRIFPSCSITLLKAGGYSPDYVRGKNTAEFFISRS